MTLFREALNHYENGATEVEKEEVVRLLPRFVSSLIRGQDIPAKLEDNIEEGIVREVLAEYQRS